MINILGSLATTYGGGRSLLALPIKLKLTRQCKLLWRLSSPFSHVTPAARHGAHSEYTSNLKDYHWLSRHLNRIHFLLGYRHNRSLNYAHLRSVINELLQLCTHATNARPYHAALSFDAAAALPQIATMLKLTFSEASNRSHESIDEEGCRTYEFIEFPAYFQICNSWNAAVDSEVLALYLHSYMNLLFDRNFLNYVTVFDVLREGEPTDTSMEIINRSVQGIAQMMQALKQKIDSFELLNPYEMAIYLKHLKNSLFEQRSATEKDKDARTLTNYILNSARQLDQSAAHSENLTYSLYLLFTLQEMRGSYVFLAFEWLSGRLRQMAGHHRQDYLLEYLMSLASHEDKLTCLKVDIWLNFLAYETPLEMAAVETRRHIQPVLLCIHHLSFNYWRYKYVFWLMDSLLNQYPGDCLPFIKHICAFLPAVTFRKYDKISSAVIFMREITERFSQISDIMSIHESLLSWLTKIPKECLKTQVPSDLCDVLSLADSHPSLQSLYTPYLLLLLELSLGHFPWIELSRVYYYGLRFGVELHSQDAQWNMEYVRRYILNEYATMGLRRREIPEDSYFYRIIGITTPEKFYKNYLKDS